MGTCGLGASPDADGFASDGTAGSRGSSRTVGRRPPKLGAHDTKADECMRGLAVWVFRFRWPLAICWPALALALSPLTVLLFENVAPFPSGAPEGSRSADAQALVSRHFEHIIGLRREMVVLRCRERCESAATQLAAGYLEEIKSLVERFESDHPGTVLQVHTYFTYRDLEDNPMISHDRQSVLLQWMWRVPDHLKGQAEAFLGEVAETIAALNHMQADDPKRLDIMATGPTFLDRVLTQVLVEEIPVHELSTMWVPFIIVACSLRSVRLLFVTMVSMPVRIFPAFAIMYLVSRETTVLCDSLNLMLMLCTGLTFDYSLFTLARYGEERAAGSSVRKAVMVMTAQSGHVVVVTGGVLMIAYGSMLALPGAFRSFCVAACAMVAICMAVQLTWIPALLAVCPFLGPPSADEGEEYSDDASDVESLDGDYDLMRQASPPPSPDTKGPRREEGPDGADGALGKALDGPVARASPHMQGTWFWIGGQLTAFPQNVLVPLLLYMLFLPLTLRTMHIHLGHGFKLQVPRHVHEWDLALEIQRGFEPAVGTFYPMLIIGTKAPGENVSLAGAFPAHGDDGVSGASTTPVPLDVRSQGFFDANCEMIERLISATQNTSYPLGPENFISATFHGEAGDETGAECLNYRLTHMYRKNFLTQKLFVTSSLLEELWDQLTNQQHDAMLTLLNPRVDPFSKEAFRLVEHLRRILRDFAPEKGRLPGLAFETLSATSAMIDIIEITTHRGKVALLACAMVCFVAIAVSFGAAAIPVKMLFTVILPLTWVYGAVMFVYEDGCLAWTGIESLSPTGDEGIHFTVFMLTPTLMLGLALDYDIFLFTRVWEFRREGFGERESIQLGLAATGPIITSAGLIMAFSFGGQLLASIPVPNQMGFCLVFSILLDTFVVRTVLVPAMLSLSPRMNYWPAVMPPPTYEWLGFAAQSGSANGLSHARLKTSDSSANLALAI